MQKQIRYQRRGIVLVWVAVTMLTFIAMVALAMDTGLAVLAKQQLRAAADAAALAGAAQLRSGIEKGYYTYAASTAMSNKVIGTPVSLATPDVVPGRYYRKGTSNTKFGWTTDTPYNAVKVTARRTGANALPLVFGTAFGVNTTDLQVEAIAMCGGGSGGDMVVLDETGECALNFKGTSTLKVLDASVNPPVPSAIQINSNNPCAVCNTGKNHPTIQASEINSVGTSCLEGVDYIPPDPLINNGSKKIPDPLGYLKDLTSWGTDRPSPPKNGDWTGEPGYYATGIDRTGGKLTLNPGIYVVDSQNKSTGLNVTGNAEIVGNGVMFYLVNQAAVTFDTTGSITLTPPDPTLYPFPGAQDYEGITIFQARGNTEPAKIIGNNDMNIGGAIYFPSNEVDVGGTSSNFGTQLVAFRVTISGNGEITISSKGKLPGPGNKVFLIQ